MLNNKNNQNNNKISIDSLFLPIVKLAHKQILAIKKMKDF